MSDAAILPSAPPATAAHLCLARQAIFDVQGRVFAYELLYRASPDAVRAEQIDGDMAAAHVLTTAASALGMEALTGGRKAFINVTRNVLLNGIGVLSPETIVIEVLESVQIDRDVIDACRTLKRDGYAIALDDFVPGSDAEALMPYAAFVKVDVLALSTAERARIARRLLPRGIRMLAEKVETAEVAALAKAEGYSLFQGYYFLRPEMQVARHVPESQITYMRLLTALSRSDLTVNELEDLVKTDVSLSYRILRTVNSSAFALRREVTSMRQALVLLGQEQIRKWAAVWVLAGLNHGGVPETLTVALVRARACELLGASVPHLAGQPGLFLLGLCSVLDAILGCPMPELVERLSLGPTLADALLGRSSPLLPLLTAAVNYEQARWAEADACAEALGVPPARLREVYAEALAWARELQTAA